MTAFAHLKFISDKCCGFWSTERVKERASNSEMKRWFDKKSVIINGECRSWNEEIDEDLFELILFPKSDKKRISFRF